MKTALDVQREMSNYQPRYQKKDIRQKLDQAISSREYEEFSERYLDRVINRSIVRNQSTSGNYDDKKYPFVILEKWIKYEDLLTELISIAYLDNKEREIFLNSKKLFAYIVCKVKHQVKASMRKRGFKYQKSQNIYLDSEGKPHGDLFPCFVIKPKTRKVCIYLGLTLSVWIIICLIFSVLLHTYVSDICKSPVLLLGLAILLFGEYSISDDSLKTKIHNQQQILLEKERKD